LVTYRISFIPGDGIGPEVMAEGRRVLDAASDVEGFEIEWRDHPYGADHYLKTGVLMEEEDFKEVGDADAIYFGAIASALLFHDTKITSYSYPSLAESFKTMTEKRWMAPELARHFSKARNLCKKKTK